MVASVMSLLSITLRVDLVPYPLPSKRALHVFAPAMWDELGFVFVDFLPRL